MTSISKWVDFFEKAGLPRDAANTYAHSFTENRIQLSMLPDLNKEYLREMGIFRMGDIILILRQAKIVQEHGGSMRSSSGIKPGGVKRGLNSDDDTEDEIKPVLKRKAVVLADNPEPKSIVRRAVLQKEELSPVRSKNLSSTQRTTVVLKSNDREVPQRITVSNKTANRGIDIKSTSGSGSIFLRLGSKNADGTLSDKKIIPPSKQPVKNQRVLLVKKVPAKATYASESSSSSEENSEDDANQHMNTSLEKSVSFSTQDEIIEIAKPKKGILKTKPQQGKSFIKNLSVKERLGLKTPIKNASQALAKMRLQQSPQKKSVNNKKAIQIGTLRSDDIFERQNQQNIHDRLFAKKSPQLSSPIKKQVVNRKVIKVPNSNNNKNGTLKAAKLNSSVFDRLG